MARETDVSRMELVQMQRNAFGISWISGWKRNHYLQRLEEFERRNLGSGGDGQGGKGNGNGVAAVVDDGGGDGEGTGVLPERNPSTEAEDAAVPSLAS